MKLHGLRDKLWKVVRWDVQDKAWWSRCNATVLYKASQEVCGGPFRKANIAAAAKYTVRNFANARIAHSDYRCGKMACSSAQSRTRRNRNSRWCAVPGNVGMLRHRFFEIHARDAPCALKTATAEGPDKR